MASGTRKPTEPPLIAPNAAAERGIIAHKLRAAMGTGVRVNIDAGPRSCMGVVVRVENDTSRLSRVSVERGESTLTAVIEPNPGFPLIEVPVQSIASVKLA